MLEKSSSHHQDLEANVPCSRPPDVDRPILFEGGMCVCVCVCFSFFFGV